ncbi:MAG: CAP domain-containing protein [Solirubrobacterales bacterium]|nr:CAP domain-containing protein [Solirubrobacterales bacterium]
MKAKERAIRTCANQLRVSKGLEPLRYSPSLAKAARFQSRNMARRRFFDHTDPAGRGVARRVARYTDHFGKRVGENIGAGRRTSSATCRSWFKSSGHRANILDPDYTSIGTGFATGGAYRRYYTQVFGTGR